MRRRLRRLLVPASKVRRKEEPLFEFAIGIYAGRSPFELAPHPMVSSPVITQEAVTDERADLVADPFMVRAEGRWHMFFEVVNRQTWKGKVGLAQSDDGLSWTYRGIVLAEPFHLSYPYVFEWRDEFYMIPESYKAGAVRLYRAVDFPTRWSCVRTLLQGSHLRDASILRHDGRWWLFAETSPRRTFDTLRLYHAQELTGPWREHPRSPIVRENPRAARPAGRLLPLGGTILRFAQDCVPHYGTRVRAFEITELTPRHYRERPASERPVLGPGPSGWNADGMHHLDLHPDGQGGWIACVDGWSWVG
ncbi:MAG: glucosamine inositolphosphorylceramide transferase family protein [bacterium]